MAYSLNDELKGLLRNIDRTAYRMEVINSRLRPGDCCAHCASEEYRMLSDRMDRLQARKQILDGKLLQRAHSGFVSKVCGVPANVAWRAMKNSTLPIVTAAEDVLHPRLTDEQLEPFKVRYARAWGLWRDAGDNGELKAILEREMDECQNHFKMDQFAAFKKTLPGFTEAWDQMHAGVLAAFARKFPKLKRFLPDK